MPKDKYQDIKQKWKREHTEAFTFRLLKDKEADVIEFIKANRPIKPKLVEIIRDYMSKN